MQQFVMSSWIKRRMRASSLRATRVFVGHTGLVLLLVACMFSCADCQGLFPPTRLGRNLAPFNRVEATSICGETEEGVGQAEDYCAPDGSLLTCRERICDGGCLYESRVSNGSGLDVLAEGTLGPNVVGCHIYVIHSTQTMVGYTAEPVNVNT